jgi:hypothetical protein
LLSVLCQLPQDLSLRGIHLCQSRLLRWWRWRWWRSLATISTTTFALVKATRRAARSSYHLQKRQIGQSEIQSRGEDQEQGSPKAGQTGWVGSGLGLATWSYSDLCLSQYSVTRVLTSP